MPVLARYGAVGKRRAGVMTSAGTFIIRQTH